MNFQSKILLVILSLFLLIPAKAYFQETKDSKQKRIINAAIEIMTSAQTCALITLDEENHPSIRMMDPFPPESDFTVWLGTNPNSRKVAQIKKNPQVTLYYIEKENLGYVMIQGTATLVSPTDNRSKWKKEWKAFYPDPANDLLLIKVIPTSMEVVSYKHNVLGDPTTWKPSQIIFNAN